MISVETVGPDEFRTALVPLVTFLRGFTTAVHAVSDRHGSNPWTDSPAMTELADDTHYAARSGWDGPITNTHAMGGLTLMAAEDYVRSFAEALASERPPVYGHLVLARAALESSVVCAWLNEDGIARDERVKRGLSEYIYAAVEEERLGLQDDTTVVDDFIAHAAALGWGVTDHNGKTWRHNSRGNPGVDGVSRPPTARGIRDLLVGSEESRIGRMLWSRLSAVAHVTYFGLRWAFVDEERRGGNVATVQIGTDLHTVYRQALCISKALRQAANTRFVFMGWLDGEWNGVAQDAQRHEVALLEASSPTAASARTEQPGAGADGA